MADHPTTHRDCEICKGRGSIVLPIYRPVVMTPLAEVAPPGKHSRTYPCPECSAKVGSERIAILNFHAVVSSTISDPDFIRYAQKGAAHRLINELLRGDFIRFERGPTDEINGTYPLRASLGVVSTAQVATLEQRVKQDREQFGRDLVVHAAHQIRMWGSHHHGDWGPISKEQAISALSSALQAILAKPPTTRLEDV